MPAPDARPPHPLEAALDDAEPFGKLHLVNGASRRQDQIENLVAQQIIDHLHAGAALALGRSNYIRHSQILLVDIKSTIIFFRYQRRVAAPPPRMAE